MTIHTHPLIVRDLADAGWSTSSYSGNGNNCVEVADLSMTPNGGMAARDSKNSDGPALLMAHVGWSTFVTAVKRGEFPNA
jgi:uncharacterized protein DUF397